MLFMQHWGLNKDKVIPIRFTSTRNTLCLLKLRMPLHLPASFGILINTLLTEPTPSLRARYDTNPK